MGDEPDNLVLAMLREIRAQQDKHMDLSHELLSRVSRLEQSLAHMSKRVADIEIAMAEMSARIDRIDGRIDRIERRLGLVEAS